MPSWMVTSQCLKIGMWWSNWARKRWTAAGWTVWPWVQQTFEAKWCESSFESEIYIDLSWFIKSLTLLHQVRQPPSCEVRSVTSQEKVLYGVIVSTWHDKENSWDFRWMCAGTSAVFWIASATKTSTRACTMKVACAASCVPPSQVGSALLWETRQASSSWIFGAATAFPSQQTSGFFQLPLKCRIQAMPESLQHLLSTGQMWTFGWRIWASWATSMDRPCWWWPPKQGRTWDRCYWKDRHACKYM